MTDRDPYEFGGWMAGVVIGKRLWALTASGETFLLGVMLLRGGFHFHLGPVGLLSVREG